MGCGSHVQYMVGVAGVGIPDRETSYILDQSFPFV